MPTQSSTSEFCHCGATFGGSDHCGYCSCEQYESSCFQTQAWTPTQATVHAAQLLEDDGLAGLTTIKLETCLDGIPGTALWLADADGDFDARIILRTDREVDDYYLSLVSDVPAVSNMRTWFVWLAESANPNPIRVEAVTMFDVAAKFSDLNVISITAAV